jgi:hypothetical protein
MDELSYIAVIRDHGKPSDCRFVSCGRHARGGHSFSGLWPSAWCRWCGWVTNPSRLQRAYNGRWRSSSSLQLINTATTAQLIHHLNNLLATTAQTHLRPPPRCHEHERPQGSHRPSGAGSRLAAAAAGLACHDSPPPDVRDAWTPRDQWGIDGADIAQRRAGQAPEAGGCNAGPAGHWTVSRYEFLHLPEQWSSRAHRVAAPRMDRESPGSIKTTCLLLAEPRSAWAPALPSCPAPRAHTSRSRAPLMPALAWRPAEQ